MNKSLIKVFQVYVFVFAFLFASRQISDADFWFYLKTGEYILNTGTIPRNELWSFTFPGVPYIAHGWLAGVIFYVLYTWVGPNFLIFLFALLTAIAFWIAFKRSDSHPVIAGAAALTAVWAALPNIGVRPRVFTILLTSIFLAVLGRLARGVKDRWIWLLIPLMTFWVNIHGGFFIGLMLIGLTAVGLVIDYWAGVLGEPETLRPRLRLLAIVFVCCILAGLLNPYGIKPYTAPITLMRSSIWQDLIVDWLSPDFHLPTTRPLLMLMLGTIALFGLSPKRPKPSELLLFVATLYSTLKIQRNAVVFVLVSAPLFSKYFQIWVDSTRFNKYFSSTGQASSNRRLPVLMTIALLSPLIPFALKLKSTVYSTPTQRTLRVPIKAVEYLNQNGISGNTFTQPNVWGGYLIWAAPNNRVYIDGRDAYPDTFVKEFVDIISGKVDWRAPFKERGVQLVLLEPKTYLARQLDESSSEWEKIYEDEISLVYRRR
ncbi:MAG TPA: hypothetical protein VJM50_01400 [Pyrinomonadaceae bacterium]|nr:hypothetical protein [Pyrinomonadaceae bacterium]